MQSNDKKDQKLAAFNNSVTAFVELVVNYKEQHVVDYSKNLSPNPNQDYLTQVSGDAAQILSIIPRITPNMSFKENLIKTLSERMPRLESNINLYKTKVGGDTGTAICTSLLKDLNELKPIVGMSCSSSPEMSSPAMKKS
jgi:hypothetical protein